MSGFAVRCLLVTTCWKLIVAIPDFIKIIPRDAEPGPPYCTNGYPWWGLCRSQSYRFPIEAANLPVDFPVDADDLLSAQTNGKGLPTLFFPNISSVFLKTIGAFYTDMVYEYGKRAGADPRYVEKHINIYSSWIALVPVEYRPAQDIFYRTAKSANVEGPPVPGTVIQNFDKTQSLSMDNNSVDLVTIAMSLETLSKPVDVLREVLGKLKPGGFVAISLSDWAVHGQQAGPIWSQLDDLGRVALTVSLLHYAGFHTIDSYNVTGTSIVLEKLDNPLYLVLGKKSSPIDDSDDEL